MSESPLKIFLVQVITHQWEKVLIEQKMEELDQLVRTYGGLTVVEIVQQRAKPDYQFFVGRGKLEEIALQMQAQWATLLIIDNILKPQQIYKVNEFLKPYKLEAWDRVDLILKIFDRHATSMEARLQIELAAIRHMWPRIFGMGMELSRQWWGKGNVRGIGETNTERMRRHLAQRKEQVVEKLQQYEHMRAVHRAARKRSQLPTVWLVGYTNAGKSSLMHALTKKDVLIEDKLFATLGTTVGKLRIADTDTSKPGKEVLINDTIWFMRDLPPDLIQAFKSTLEDSIEADILLHVIDAGDPLVHDKIEVVETILDEIWAKQERRRVFNKIDTIDQATLALLTHMYQEKNCFFVSAVSGTGIADLTQALWTRLVV